MPEVAIDKKPLTEKIMEMENQIKENSKSFQSKVEELNRVIEEWAHRKHLIPNKVGRAA